MDDTKRRVLYVEDELSNRRLLELKLDKAGIQCDTAQNGLEAITLCRNNTYNIVILDYYMPGMSGVETAEKINEICPGIPMFAVTSDDDLKHELDAAGFKEILVKPLHGNEIVELIKSYL